MTALHGGVLWAVMASTPVAESGEPAGAVMIELAPIPAAPDVPQHQMAVGEQQTASLDDTPTEETKEPEEVEPEPQPEPVVETPKRELPELEQRPDAEAVLPARPETPPEPEVKKEEPKEEVKPKKKPPKRQASAAAMAAAPQPSQARKARTSAARNAGTASSASIATWRGAIMARINRYKRHPGGGASGTSTIVFAINRSGKILSVRLVRSSGNGALDRAALSLGRRMGSLPPPPAKLAGTRFTLPVSIRFVR